MSQEQTLRGHIALITGGSRGLGRDTALSLAKRGCDIILTYRNQRAAGEAVVAELESMSRQAVALQLDVAELAEFGTFRERVTEALQHKWSRQELNILVNNAGIGAHTPIGQTDEATFDQLVNIHLKGAYFLTETLLPLVAEGGRFINVSTGLTRFTLPGYAAYASVKGAIEVFTRYLAKELGGRGITANVVAPGAIDNDFNKHAFDANPQIKDVIAGNTALGRVGVSEDIGSVVAFLCSQDAGWITGQRIEASGGMFL